jgi:hypothetical protein
MGSGSLWRHIVYLEPAPGGDRHGATPGRVVRLVLSRVCMVVCLGVLVGLGLSVWVSKLVAPLLYGLEPGDARVFGSRPCDGRSARGMGPRAARSAGRSGRQFSRQIIEADVYGPRNPAAEIPRFPPAFTSSLTPPVRFRFNPRNPLQAENYLKLRGCQKRRPIL